MQKQLVRIRNSHDHVSNPPRKKNYTHSLISKNQCLLRLNFRWIETFCFRDCWDHINEFYMIFIACNMLKKYGIELNFMIFGLAIGGFVSGI